MMDERLHTAVLDIMHRRDQIIEDYIKFWLAVMVPDQYLTPEYLAENFCMYQNLDLNKGYMYMGFKPKLEKCL